MNIKGETSVSTTQEDSQALSAGDLRKILHRICTAQHDTNHHLHRIEIQMADIQTSLADLQAAVQTAVDDLGPGVQELKDALATAQGDLAALQVQDDADKAALAQSLADTQAAADQIETQVAALNSATGATPPPVAS